MLIESGPFTGLEQNGHGVILADPAWAFVTFTGSGTPQRAEEQHYAVMTLDDLKKLPVGDLAAKNCCLLMWVIGSHLDAALELGKAWGFKYKTDLLTWVKVGKYDPKLRPISMGFWSRKQTEMCLIFTKGKPKRLDAGIRQLIETDEHIIYAPKREHSRKPDEQYERIEKLVGGPYVELFARHSRDGWSTWGNERTRFDLALPAPVDSMFDDLLGQGDPPCRYCDGSGWFYGDKELGPCTCVHGDQFVAPEHSTISRSDDFMELLG